MFDTSKSTAEPSSDVSGQDNLVGDSKQVSGPELPLFNFDALATATDNFSEHNKLGQGGFGPVYKVTRDLNRCSQIHKSLSYFVLEKILDFDIF